ncbi:hypothetical protein BO71DRAFT_441547 [Aspergillus ellipticus CBS 707.79]|uniref:Uncharacterized protein n=1 Tax=Aspergillus ellipticus CBS 707.79 TaxID=1448320 RepID=A0A319D8V8_9EURO|nr:hypothetical protein BO71DRAFT_441547 [Aspergillus ellipticus CBS 707.79]
MTQGGREGHKALRQGTGSKKGLHEGDTRKCGTDVQTTDMDGHYLIYHPPQFHDPLLLVEEDAFLLGEKEGRDGPRQVVIQTDEPCHTTPLHSALTVRAKDFRLFDGPGPEVSGLGTKKKKKKEEKWSWGRGWLIGRDDGLGALDSGQIAEIMDGT